MIKLELTTLQASFLQAALDKAISNENDGEYLDAYSKLYDELQQEINQYRAEQYAKTNQESA